MNILYISPENTVGTLDLYKRIHEQHGNTVRYVTFFARQRHLKKIFVLIYHLILHGPF